MKYYNSMLPGVSNRTGVRSSYKNSLDFSDIFKTILFLRNPARIVEFGILDGFSLSSFARNAPVTCRIEAYDLFEDFNGKHSDYTIVEKFKTYPNIEIKKGDFYKLVDNFEDGSLDIIHIDIANDGDTYEFAIANYLGKLSKNGVMILEGGSEERDKVDWMIKYSKPKIRKVLEKYADRYNVITLDKFPSMTLIRRLET